MKKGLIGIVLVGAFLGTACAETFYLKHDVTGKVYGPFQTDAGTVVKIGSATFTVVQDQRGNSGVEDALDAIRVPQVDFRNVPLSECIKFMRAQVQRSAPNGQAMNLVLVEPKAVKPRPPADPFAGLGGFSGSRASVNLQLQDVSALELLKKMMEQTGATYKVSGNTITVYPK